MSTASAPGGAAGEVRELIKVPSTIAMFRLSAVMWNAHRVHYDRQYATQVEGHAGLLVQATLLSSYLCELAMGWDGPNCRLRRLTFQTRAPVYDNEQLTVWGRTVATHSNDGRTEIELELGIDKFDGADRVTAVTGTARVQRTG